jgi:photosystem II stability/assembly factor-like uncharacterized protein
LTTQSKNGLVNLGDRSVIGTASIWARNPDAQASPPATTFVDSTLPQHFTNGYLVGVEAIYLGAQAGNNWVASDNLTVSIVMECTVETLTSAAAMALALSQQ